MEYLFLDKYMSVLHTVYLSVNGLLADEETQLRGMSISLSCATWHVGAPIG